MRDVEIDCEYWNGTVLKATQWRKSAEAEVWWYICINTLRESSW